MVIDVNIFGGILYLQTHTDTENKYIYFQLLPQAHVVWGHWYILSWFSVMGFKYPWQTGCCFWFLAFSMLSLSIGWLKRLECLQPCNAKKLVLTFQYWLIIYDSDSGSNWISGTRAGWGLDIIFQYVVWQPIMFYERVDRILLAPMQWNNENQAQMRRIHAEPPSP